MWNMFWFVQFWNVVAVLVSYLFCLLPFVKSHFVTKPIMETDIVGWTPFLVLFILTAVYYVWVTVRYSRSGVALFDQPLLFAFYSFLAMGLATKTPFFLNSAWNYFQFWAIEFWEVVSVLVGTLAGAIW